MSRKTLGTNVVHLVQKRGTSAERDFREIAQKGRKAKYRRKAQKGFLEKSRRRRFLKNSPRKGFLQNRAESDFSEIAQKGIFQKKAQKGILPIFGILRKFQKTAIFRFLGFWRFLAISRVLGLLPVFTYFRDFTIFRFLGFSSVGWVWSISGKQTDKRHFTLATSYNRVNLSFPCSNDKI